MPGALTLLAVGDVAPSQDSSGNQFDRVRTALRAADVTFGQLEEPLSNRGARQLFAGLGGPVWDGPPMDAHKSAALLIDAGFDVMSFAGNHTMDRSEESVVDTLDAARQAGIALVGAGLGIEAARTPAIVEIDGTTIGFLGYCSVLPPGYAATPDKAGVAPLRARTFYEQTDWQAGTKPRIVTTTYTEDLEAMLNDVRELRSQVDVVVLSVHWGVHFEPATIAMYQTEIAHAAIDAGVDLVLGHHAHIMKGIEVYRGKAIVYSLNNFSLRPRGDDGKWLGADNQPSDQQKSMMVRCTIADKAISRVSVLPCWLDTGAQPEPVAADDPRSDSILDYLRWACAHEKLNTEFTREGDEFVVTL
jgi:poly-gamma-glutamate capsule biosynthesis protein CapA/YwtB (metallophosphatase superfamily)